MPTDALLLERTPEHERGVQRAGGALLLHQVLDERVRDACTALLESEFGRMELGGQRVAAHAQLQEQRRLHRGRLDLGALGAVHEREADELLVAVELKELLLLIVT